MTFYRSLKSEKEKENGKNPYLAVLWFGQSKSYTHNPPSI